MPALCVYDVLEGRATETTLDTPLPTEGYRWVHFDLNDPELDGWARAHLPRGGRKALLQTETRPRMLALDEGLAIILRGVNLNPGQFPDDMVSVRIWIAPRLAVTVRARKVYAIDEIRQEAARGTAPDSPDAFLALLADGLAGRMETETEALEDRVDEIEELLFDDPDEDEEKHRLPELRRATIRLRRFALPQAMALEEAARSGHAVLGREAVAALHETGNRARRAVELLDAARDRLNALADHVDMQQQGRLAKNSYVFSVIAAVFLPLSFLTGLFGVNVAGMPGTQTPGAFAVLTAATVAVGIVMALILRWLRLF
ncbi:zinc transporter ZntB [Aquicoccus sp. SCR17]|nr:zinc transporter ZntB [Carideicomes alvinocaridis]